MNILISGSNRGLGLELARQYAEDGWRVFAACRHPAEAGELQALAEAHADISVHRLDVTRPHEVRALSWALEGEPLDVLFNNAGVYLEGDYREPTLGGIRYADWLHTFEVNTLGAVRLTEALRGNLAAGEQRLLVCMTSHMGSIADIDGPGSYYYRSSKAALNAAMRGLAHELAPLGIGVLLLHPGGVDTRMGPRDGIPAADSVSGLRRVIAQSGREDSGRFVRYDGTPMPW
jgi:NAD(P)-dependent dehydrogenase (short-subunit alcohol dehydrogenase family)